MAVGDLAGDIYLLYMVELGLSLILHSWLNLLGVLGKCLVSDLVLPGHPSRTKGSQSSNVARDSCQLAVQLLPIFGTEQKEILREMTQTEKSLLHAV
jgi:hypothetical protein